MYQIKQLKADCTQVDKNLPTVSEALEGNDNCGSSPETSSADQGWLRWAALKALTSIMTFYTDRKPGPPFHSRKEELQDLVSRG